MILSYLILGHLIGDFVLQPNKLIKWKSISQFGTIIHAAVHFSVTSLLLLPFVLDGGYYLLVAALVVAFIHIWIDEWKINYEQKHKNKVNSFVLDQFLHLTSILIVYSFLKNTSVIPAVSTQLINFASVAIISTIGIEIFHFQFKRKHSENAHLKLHKSQMLTRLLIFSLAYGGYMFFTYRFL